MNPGKREQEHSLWFLWKYQGEKSKGLRRLSLDPKAVWQGLEPEYEWEGRVGFGARLCSALEWLFA